MKNKKISLYCAIIIFIFVSYELHAMHKPQETKTIETNAGRDSRRSRMRAALTGCDEKAEQKAIAALIKATNELAITKEEEKEEVDQAGPLCDPHSLFFGSLARELYTKRNNPRALYEFLSSQRCIEYPMVLVIGYMRALKIDPHQTIIEFLHDDTTERVIRTEISLFDKAVAQRDTRVFKLLKLLDEDTIDAKLSAKKSIERFVDCYLHIIKNVKFSLSNHVLSSKRARIFPGSFLPKDIPSSHEQPLKNHCDVIRELFLLKSACPKL